MFCKGKFVIRFSAPQIGAGKPPLLWGLAHCQSGGRQEILPAIHPYFQFQPAPGLFPVGGYALVSGQNSMIWWWIYCRILPKKESVTPNQKQTETKSRSKLEVGLKALHSFQSPRKMLGVDLANRLLKRTGLCSLVMSLIFTENISTHVEQWIYRIHCKKRFGNGH